MSFTYGKKELTITESSLTVSEVRTFESLVRLGDSRELALWTIEHQDRMKNRGNEEYRKAYES